MNCNFCGKVLGDNAGGVAAHIKRCKSNPLRKPNWNEGKTKDNDTSVASMAKKKKTQTPWNKGKVGVQSSPFKGVKRGNGTPHTEQFKKEQSERKKKLYESGWEPICGRAKKYDYDSPIAGKIKVDGTWELTAAKYLDKLQVNWKRNKTRFPYTNLSGTRSTYQPDFFVTEWNSYIEVKGYETDLDRCKWKQFPEKLLVWRKEEIERIKESWVNG